jgi:hypothetical protein
MREGLLVKSLLDQRNLLPRGQHGYLRRAQYGQQASPAA